LAGSSIFGHVGICGADQGFSIQEMVIEDEMIGYIRRIFQSFEVNDEMIDLDVIKKVGRNGNFLIEEHTLKNFKRDIWFPTIYNRLSYDNWIKEEDNSLIKKASRKIRKILDRERKIYIDSSLDKELNNIIKEYMSI